MGTRTFLSLLGGGKRDRTADLLHAMQALSQLSYTPASKEGRIIESVSWPVKDISVFLSIFFQSGQNALAAEQFNDCIDRWRLRLSDEQGAQWHGQFGHLEAVFA